MQFINIIVHSVQDMNYRVYLQEEFKLLGLDECLQVNKFLLLSRLICCFEQPEDECS